MEYGDLTDSFPHRHSDERYRITPAVGKAVQPTLPESGVAIIHVAMMGPVFIWEVMQ
jgi:hypothetical protein